MISRLIRTCGGLTKSLSRTTAKLVTMPISRRAFAHGAAGFSAMVAGESLRAARPVPKLLVLIALEACRSDYLERNRPFFGNSGLLRLMDEGCYFPDCRIASSTFTSTGLATLATGAWPQLHG